MVTLDAVSRSYSDGFSISVSLEIPKGSLVSLLGPSGSGKTTTLRFIAGFEEPDSGRIIIEGSDVTAVPPADRRVGFVFQDYTLFPHMNVFENIAYGLRVRHTPAGETAERVRRFLATVGLPGYEDRSVRTLSGGERQRVALARALVVEPDVLLLDEPFSSIDAILRRDLRREVMRLQRSLGVTTIFVTHSRNEAMSIADHLVVIRNGGIVQQGRPDEVFARPTSRFAASFVGDANFLEGSLECREGRCTLHSFRDFQLSAEAAVAPTGAGPNGTPRTVLLRPHQLFFSEPNAVNAFPVEIAERQYFAHYFEYTCRSLDNPEQEIILYNETRREIGEHYHVAFPPEAAVLLPPAPAEAQS